MTDAFEERLESSILIKQGAEAKVYKLELVRGDEDRDGVTVLLKYRFPKTYRHPKLDSQLTRTRLTFEARSLTRASKQGIRVPTLKGLDLDQGWLMLEWIEGITLRDWLDSNTQHVQPSQDARLGRILKDVGIQIAKLHLADIIHGDLTTSNMILRRSPCISDPLSSSETSDPEVVLIDFGLSSVTSLIEDKAVDLYVLERAFLSTHSDPGTQLLKHSSPHFDIILEAYGNYLSKASWDALRTRLANVRMRGRKRSMVG